MNNTTKEDRPNTEAATEWLMRFNDGLPGTSLHTVVIYRVKWALDEEGDRTDIVRLWVVAYGYEGGGVFGAHSAVATFDEGDAIVARCQLPEFEDYDDIENAEIITEEDSRIICELWNKICELTNWGDRGDEALGSKLPRGDDEDSLASEGWDPHDLIEPISDGWQLFLKF